MTANQIGNLLAAVIAGVTGGSEARWRMAIGLVERLPTWKHVRFSWRVTPNAEPRNVRVIERAVEIVRAEHSYVS